MLRIARSAGSDPLFDKADLYAGGSNPVTLFSDSGIGAATLRRQL
jgi:hypothetical protein